MQNDRQRCKVKVRKFLFNILWRSGVMEENPQGGGFRRPPGMDRISKSDRESDTTIFTFLELYGT